MGNEKADKKFTWVIKNFSFLQSQFIESDQFVIDGCKWRLGFYSVDRRYLSLFLFVAEPDTLPRGWRRHTKYRLTVVNQLSEQLSQVQETQLWLDQKIPSTIYPEMIPFTKLYDKDGGFLVNNEIKIVAEVEVLQVIGKLDVFEEANQPLKRIKLDDDSVDSSDLHKETSLVTESIDVNGFQVLLSQAESVKRIFEKHPNMALYFQAKNQNVRTTCMNVLLDLIETLCHSLQDLSIDDLCQADNALAYLQNSGFKVDWLEHKLEEVKEKKMEEEIGETRMQELEEELKAIEALMEKNKEELKDLKHKCSDTEALLKKEKAKVLAARAPPLTLDAVV